ncbi:hypothetical protein I4U23_002476 [Adineta vaga]|nr:hypothetical protein I4U23_002476 [Adineta vaga]
MRATMFVIVLLIISIVIRINADPFLFLPRHMLPPIGIIYTLPFDATVDATQLSGDYVIYALTSSNSQTIIGYRAWQLYTIENTRIGYEDYYLNGTIFHSTRNSVTQECMSVFSRTANCTGWMNTEIKRWDNRCIMSGDELPPNSAAKMTVFADTTDLTRPVKMHVSMMSDISSEGTQIMFQFTSKMQGNIVPNVKCDY